jgi:hypothetical protein
VRKSVWTLVRQLAVHRGVRLSSAFALFIGMFIIYNALGMMNTSLDPDLFRPAVAKPRYPDDQQLRRCRTAYERAMNLRPSEPELYLAVADCLLGRGRILGAHPLLRLGT